MNEEIRKAFEAEFHVPDYIEFDGEDYMYYGESPLLAEQQHDISAKWRGFQAGVESIQKELSTAKKSIALQADALKDSFKEIEQLKAYRDIIKHKRRIRKRGLQTLL